MILADAATNPAIIAAYAGLIAAVTGLLGAIGAVWNSRKITNIHNQTKDVSDKVDTVQRTVNGHFDKS